MTPLWIGLLVVVCLVQRLSMTWRLPMFFDSWGHLYFLLAVKRQRTGPFSPIQVDVPGGGPFHYPLLAHWLLAFLPEFVLNRWIKVVNPVIEAVGLGLSMLLALWARIDVAVILAAGLLYIFTPMLFSKVNIGSTSQFTTRLYSELSTGLLALLAFLPLPVSGWVLSVPMALLVAFIVLSSKFGLQMVLLVVLPAALLTLKLPLLGALVLGFLLAVAVSKGSILKTWRQQGNHLIWYLRETRKGKMPIGDRNTLAPFRQAMAAPGWKQRLIHIGFVLAGRNSFTGMLLKFPVVIAVALLPFSGLPEGPVAGHGFYALLGVALAVFFIVNTTVFIVLGEAERYLNHFAFLIILVFAEWTFANGAMVWFWGAVAWGVFYWLAELILLGVLRLKQPVEDEDGAYLAVTRAAPKGSVVLSYPYHVVPPWRFLATSDLRPIFPMVGTGPQADRLKEMESYPFVDLAHLQELRRDFGLAFVMVQDKVLDAVITDHLESDGWQVLAGAKSKGITIYAHPQSADQLQFVDAPSQGREAQ